MVELKKQKPHPSSYGRWEKISYEPSSSQHIPAQHEHESGDDVDLKRLDEILSSTQSRNTKDSHDTATFDEDEHLASLTSLISGIKRRHMEEVSSDKQASPDKQHADEPQAADVLSLLEEHTSLDLKKLEEDLFGSHEPGRKDKTIEETEDEFLQELERRYKKGTSDQ